MQFLLSQFGTAPSIQWYYTKKKSKTRQLQEIHFGTTHGIQRHEKWYKQQGIFYWLTFMPLQRFQNYLKRNQSIHNCFAQPNICFG